MKNILIKSGMLVAILTTFAACQKDKNMKNDNDDNAVYSTVDQMARPAINTVFVGAARKNEFNMTRPANMSSLFLSDFRQKLTDFGYTTNALGLDKETFASVLVTDVLNVKLNGTTTFFDGVNVLTGRALADDVIDTELLLIFGGSTGTANPGLTSDNVNSNDKAFLSVFPYLAAPF